MQTKPGKYQDRRHTGLPDVEDDVELAEHPIQGLMKTAMESIKDMVDVNTVIGEPVESQDGSVIIPVSRVTFGFAAGGGEFPAEAEEAGVGQREEGTSSYPFAGGSGAGVSVQPVGFLVVGQGTVRMLPVHGGAVIDRLIDLAPQMVGQVVSLIRGRREEKEL